MYTCTTEASNTNREKYTYTVYVQCKYCVQNLLIHTQYQTIICTNQVLTGHVTSVRIYTKKSESVSIVWSLIKDCNVIVIQTMWTGHLKNIAIGNSYRLSLNMLNIEIRHAWSSIFVKKLHDNLSKNYLVPWSYNILVNIFLFYEKV